MVNTNFVTQATTGINLASSDGTTPQFALGSVFKATNGTEWIYVLASGDIGLYDYVTYNASYTAVVGTKVNAALGVGIGFAQFAIPTTEYGWVATKGVNIKAKGLASIAPNVAIYTSGSAGNLGTTATGHTKIASTIITATAGTATTGNTVNLLAVYPHFVI